MAMKAERSQAWVHKTNGELPKRDAAVKVLPSDKLSLKDRLSRLTFNEACKLLGENGQKLIQSNANIWAISITGRCAISATISFACHFHKHPVCVVTITLMAEARHRLHFHCTRCEMACDHVGAVFSLILEEKTALGLAAPPPEREPVESLNEKRSGPTRTQRSSPAGCGREDEGEVGRTPESALDRLRRHQSAERQDLSRDPARHRAGRFVLLLPRLSNEYARHLQTRDEGRGGRQETVRGRTVCAAAFDPANSPLHVHYGNEVTLQLLVPDRWTRKRRRSSLRSATRPIENLPDLLKRLAKLQKSGRDVLIYPDAEEFIQQRMAQTRLQATTAEMRHDPAGHPSADQLLKVAVAALSARRHRLRRRGRPGDPGR